MLWIHISNTGTIDCYVNVGNKLRQGNAFDAFVVVDGARHSEEEESQSIWELINVTYVKPTAESFMFAGVTIEDGMSFKTFELGAPSQANSYFIGNTSYEGRVVHFSQEATSFQGNGGHMAILFTMKSEDGNIQRAETLSVFLEPTYGNKNTPLNLNDYNELIQLYKKSVTINLGEIDDLGELDSLKYADPTPESPNENPYSFYTFTYEGNPNFLFVGYEDGETVQQRMEFDSENNVVKYSYRKTSGDSWGDWTVLYQEPISSITFDPHTTISGRDYFVMTITTISGQTYNSPPIYDGVGISQVTSEKLGQGVPHTDVTIHLTDGTTYSFSISDGNGIKTLNAQYVNQGAGYTNVTFGLDDGTQKQFRVDNGNGISSINVTPSTIDGGNNVVTINEKDGTQTTFNVKNGSKGSPALGNVGLIFMVVSDDSSSPYYYGTLGLSASSVGHLVLNYPEGQTAPNIKLVSDDPNSDSYYLTLGVPEQMVGHLLYLNS